MIQGMCQCGDWWQIHSHTPDGELITLPEDEDPEPIGVHASDGSLAYPDDPMPLNVLPLPPEEKP